MKKVIYTLFVLLLLSSCNKSGENEEMGQPHYISFTPSLSEYSFGVEGGTVTITVKPYDYTYWHLGTGGGYRARYMWDTTNKYGLSLREFVGFPLNPAPGENFDFRDFDFSDWDDNFEWFRIQHYYFYNREDIIVGIRSSWYEATRARESLHKVVVNVEPNTSGKERILGLSMGDASVRITQSAE